MIYLDNSATTFKKPDCVIDAVCDALKNVGSAGRGSHIGTLSASRIIFSCREKIADMFNVGDASRVVFTSNATESLNIAIKGLLSPLDHVITTALEHNSVLRPLYEVGCELTIAPICDKGRVDIDFIENSIKGTTKAIICTHGSNVLGNIVDIKHIGEICKKNNILFIVDASQTAGVLDIDMQKNNISVLCFTGHKGMLAPQGTGCLCIDECINIRPLKVGGSGTNSFSKTHPIVLPESLEAGTANAHSIAGLSAAVSYISDYGINTIHNQEMALANKFYNGIKNFDNVEIYGDLDAPIRVAIISLNILGISSSEVADILFEDYTICTRAGAHCAPLVHKSIGTENQGMVRFSFSHFNTVDDVDTAIHAIKTISNLAKEQLSDVEN